MSKYIRNASMKALTVTLLLFMQLAFADQNDDTLCDIKIDYSPKHYIDLSKKALKLSKDICLTYGRDENITDPTIRAEYAIFGKELELAVKNKFSHIPKSVTNDLFDQLSAYSAHTQRLDKNQLISFYFSLGSSIGSMSEYGFDVISDAYTKFDPDISECNINDKPNCTSLLKELHNVVELVKKGYVQRSAKKVSEEIQALNEHWERYLKVSRAQTSLDIMVTSALNESVIKSNHLVRPMEVQYFLLHPSIVYESVPSASDGSNDDLSFAIEWIGFNFWDKNSTCLNKLIQYLWEVDCIRMPIGASLTSVYSDRPEVSDDGHGIAVHIGNSYTIGWASRHGYPGYYLSIDLYKLFQDTNDDWDNWKQKLNKMKF